MNNITLFNGDLPQGREYYYKQLESFSSFVRVPSSGGIASTVLAITMYKYSVKPFGYVD
jgi:hypothetical protein